MLRGVPTGKWLLTSITAAAVLPALAVVLVPTDGVAGPRGAGAPTVPDRVAEYSHLTASVSSSPPGRAVALFQHGFGVEFLDGPQAVVVGADGDVVRRVDLAEDRAGAETQGDPAPMLLSPDGTRIAVGDHDTRRPDLAVLDLTDGGVDLHPVPDGRSVIPLAWSPDGRLLAYLSTDAPTNPYGGAIAGDVGLLDLDSGRATDLRGASDVSTTAFSPDGSELAVQHSAAAGGGLEVLSLDGAGTRTLAVPDGRRLDGPAAWSPDGRLLAVTAADCPGMSGEGWRGCSTPGGGGIAFVDATGAGGPTPAPLTDRVVGPGRVLGWPAADRVAVLVPDAAGGDPHDPDQHWLTEVPLDGSASRRLSAVPTSEGSYGVGRFQLATGLLGDLGVREAGAVDRGRWPLWARGGAVLTLGVTAACAAGILLGRSRRRRTTA